MLMLIVMLILVTIIWLLRKNKEHTLESISFGSFVSGKENGSKQLLSTQEDKGAIPKENDNIVDEDGPDDGGDGDL